MTTKTRTVVTILAAIAIAVMLVSVAFNGYRSLTRPPVVISGIPADPPSAVAIPSAPVSPMATPETGQPQSPAVKHGRSTASQRSKKRRSGKIAKLTSPAQGRIDINTAASAELQRLPGVGPAMAQRIIGARQSFGGFRTAQDLLEVRGIGPKKFAKMEAFVKT